MYPKCKDIHNHQVDSSYILLNLISYMLFDAKYTMRYIYVANIHSYL